MMKMQKKWSCYIHEEDRRQNDIPTFLFLVILFLAIFILPNMIPHRFETRSRKVNTVLKGILVREGKKYWTGKKNIKTKN